MGGNPAENHPCGFKWVVEAKRNRNAKMIVVDPRFTRTASQADLFLQIRAGSRHRLPRRADQLRHREQSRRQGVSRQLHQRRLHHQGRLQAAGGRTVLRLRCRPRRPTTRATWNYQEGGNETGKVVPVSAATRRPRMRLTGPAARRGSCRSARQRDRHPAKDRVIRREPGRREGDRRRPDPPPSLPPNVAYDLSLQHPRCVYQLLKQQYSRYTPEMVAAHHRHSQGPAPEGLRTCSPPFAKTAT